jgi:hypothetical protein
MMTLHAWPGARTMTNPEEIGKWLYSEEHIERAEALMDIVEQEPDAIKQLAVIELLFAMQCFKAGTKDFSYKLVDGAHKHTKQWIDQLYDDVAGGRDA